MTEGPPGPVGYTAARNILAAYGVRFCRDRLVDSPEAAVAAADALGYPVAVKSARADLLHKTEAGAVAADLRNRDEALSAARRITRLGGGPLLVQEQVAPGVELLVGGRRAAGFGPLVVVGTGGFWTEAVRDVSAALTPVSLEEARTLVSQGLRGRLLAGYRGLARVDPEPVARALVAVGALLADHPRIAEVDVNPLIARGADLVAVDALLLLGDRDCDLGDSKINLT